MMVVVCSRVREAASDWKMDKNAPQPFANSAKSPLISFHNWQYVLADCSAKPAEGNSWLGSVHSKEKMLTKP